MNKHDINSTIMRQLLKLIVTIDCTSPSFYISHNRYKIQNILSGTDLKYQPMFIQNMYDIIDIYQKSKPKVTQTLLCFLERNKTIGF